MSSYWSLLSFEWGAFHDTRWWWWRYYHLQAGFVGKYLESFDVERSKLSFVAIHWLDYAQASWELWEKRTYRRIQKTFISENISNVYFLSRSDHFKECQFLGFSQFNIHFINIKQIFISFYGRHWLSRDNLLGQFISCFKRFPKSERQHTNETEIKHCDWWCCEAAQAEDGDRHGAWWWGSLPPSQSPAGTMIVRVLLTLLQFTPGRKYLEITNIIQYIQYSPILKGKEGVGNIKK